MTEARHKRFCIVWRHLYEMSRIEQATETEMSRLVVTRGWGRGWGGAWGVAANGCGFPFGVMTMFWNQIEVMVTQHCARTKRH